MLDTLRFRDGALELLDQRVLPERIAYVRCESAAATADAIRDMVVRGAPAIGCAAAYGVAVEALRVRRGLMAARRGRVGGPSHLAPLVLVGLSPAVAP